MAGKARKRAPDEAAEAVQKDPGARVSGGQSEKAARNGSAEEKQKRNQPARPARSTADAAGQGPRNATAQQASGEAPTVLDHRDNAMRGLAGQTGHRVENGGEPGGTGRGTGHARDRSSSPERDESDDDQQAEEEQEAKIRLFEVMEWWLHSITKMCVFVMIKGVGLWRLRETGAVDILVKEQRRSLGAQTSVLMAGSDLFKANIPLVGMEERVARYGAEEWQFLSAQKRDSILDYLKTGDHVINACKWIEALMQSSHVALRPFRKVVAGGIVVLPGDRAPIALDLREGTGPRAVAVSGTTAHERWETLQELAMPAVATEEERAQRKDLVFIFEVRHRDNGVTFSAADFATPARIEQGMRPFTDLLRLLHISSDDERFLLKWLVLVLRQEVVPVVMVQSLRLANLLFHTFISPAAICVFKMHQQLPANGPRATSFPAILCPDVSGTLRPSAPLFALIEQLQTLRDKCALGKEQSPPPALLLVCAPNQVPTLAGGAGTASSAVRFIHSPVEMADVRKVENLVWDTAHRAEIKKALVFAVAHGANLLREDNQRLMSPTSPPLLTQVHHMPATSSSRRSPF